MFPGFDEQLRRYADVIVQVGLNLRRGQRILISDPYTLHGVSRAAATLVDAVAAAARTAGAAGVEVLWGDEAVWRHAAHDWPHAPFIATIEQNARRITESIARGDALVFLETANPGLGAGLPAAGVAGLRHHGTLAYASFAPALLSGATNWTAAPAPTPPWADTVFADLPAADRPAALWSAVFAACRCHDADPIAAWRIHLSALEQHRDHLDRQRLVAVRLRGPGTDQPSVVCEASLSPSG